ncbi:hypothetical protein K490DRAFT_61244 [Saccharata proteae CBS 121410]|uniref:DNA replication checkpoint mediator MRC1 domain-containing protein n=1 Tax=Saccharata proteae CBS 121410 TaxID=1314787 RepID=A0A9P4I1J0_9PEZI|nr:hypothetical protein K490DRAFT_61244 [Saccharata proteae CBS 121410]
MSSPSTPARARGASSAASTPSSNHGPGSPIDLTPRSKVRAMLARFEDDSEAEDIQKEGSGPEKPTNATTKPSAPARISPAQSGASSSEDDEEDVPIRPAGRMAARLTEQTTKLPDTSDDDGADAYQRVRKMLMKPKTNGKRASKANNVERTIGNLSGLDADDDQDSGSEKPENMTSEPELPRSRTPAHRRSSPGLFVSPEAPSSQARASAMHDRDSGSDSLPENPASKSRLQELVAKKKAERESREAADRKRREEARRAAKKADARSRRINREIEGEETDGSDGEGAGRKLTQQARPTRRAGKKALEEMNRETQRMNRNMQLAHQAKTKKRYSTKDLFAKLNYGQTGEDQSNQNGPTTTSSDIEMQNKDTPPTSPPSLDDLPPKPTEAASAGLQSHDQFPPDTVIDIGAGLSSDEDLPDLKEVLSRPRRNIDKGKNKTVDGARTEAGKSLPATETRQEVPIRSLRIVHPPDQQNAGSDSDDLEIIKPHSRFPVFDRIPERKAKESLPMLHLRHLAHLTSPSKSRQKDSKAMNPTELQNFLQQRARQQARANKEEKINDLRARGIIIQTEEEREKDQLELENLLEKARKEAMELARKEKSEKKDGDNDENALPDSDDDEEWVEEVVDDDEGEEAELEMSGSEDEEENDDEEAGSEANELVNEEAGEAEAEEEDTDGSDQELEEPEEETSMRESQSTRLPPNRRRVVIDDEDEDPDDSPIMPSSTQPKATESTNDDPMAAFGFAPVAAPLGLSQMFAGTMANIETQQDSVEAAPRLGQEDSLDFLRDMPVATIPEFPAKVADDSQPQDMIVRDSQPTVSQVETQDQVDLGLSQFPSQGMFQETQLSEMPDPTQDGGFEVSRTPGRMMPSTIASTHETVDTVILPVDESPVAKKKGRLQRRSAAFPVLSDVDEAGPANQSDDDDDEEFEISANAFDVLKMAAKKPTKAELFDRKKSAAKNVVDEQAEESEDEYAGLGGADGEESDGELDEELQEMLDESNIKVDERKMAAFHAEKERADDEKRVDKLYKDITTGGLRRKRGGEFELSDSDDDGEERRRRKQREFARMRKALLEDEKIGKIAENPKKLAFLRAIEDREDDDDLEFLEALEEPSQSQSVPDSQEPTNEAPQQGGNTTAPGPPMNPLKRKNTFVDEKENRAPFSHRRVAINPAKKPATLAEIRESVSFLIDEPVVEETQFSASEDEDGTHEEAVSVRDPFAARRTNRAPVVDRLSLMRSGTSNVSTTSAAGDQPLAFHAPTAGHTPGFRVPALLRRATTNMSAASETGVEVRKVVEAQAGVRRGGSKKSNIHYQAREAERRVVLEKVEERRRAGLKKKVGEGKRRSVLGVLRKGEGFE